MEKGGMKIVQCPTCSMRYVDPVPAEFALGDYYNTEGAKYYLSADKLASDYAPVRFERELCLFRQHCRQGAVLDVGCSSGAFLFQLNKRCAGEYQICGTDVSGPPLDYAESQGVPVVRGNFLERDFRKRFDAITFWAVLEHLLEPKRFLEKTASLLKEGGLCFVLVPNMSSLAVRLLGRRYRYIYAQHLNYFTGSSMRRLVQSRFSVIENRTTHFNPIVIWQDWRGCGGEVSNRERGELLRKTTGYKENPLLAPVRFGYRMTEKILSAFGLADNLVFVLKRI